MPHTTHQLNLTVRDVPGVLVRVAQVFSRRGANIRSIHVEPLREEHWSMMTIAVRDIDRLEPITKQLEKLVDVHSVRTSTREQ